MYRILRLSLAGLGFSFLGFSILGCGVSTTELSSLTNPAGLPLPGGEVFPKMGVNDPGIGNEMETEVSESPFPSKGKVVNRVAFPSPDRTNPFEMSGEFREGEIEETPGKKREIRVIGFVEVDQPAAVLSIDGNTHILKVGESVRRVTILEIRPPVVRLSYDGVTWNASLFDRKSD